MKLIIDISDELFNIFKKHGIMAFDYFNEYDKDQIAIAIAHGTPYNQQGDLISRSALKTELEMYRHTRNYKSDEDEAQNILLDYVLEDIDEAQAVDLWQMRQEATENALKKAREEDKWGKWVITEVHCPECLGWFNTDCYSTEELNKCPSCGATMKGGAE